MQDKETTTEKLSDKERQAANEEAARRATTNSPQDQPDADRADQGQSGQTGGNQGQTDNEADQR